MNRTAYLFAAALVAFGGMIAAIDNPAEAGRRNGAGIAAGIVLGVVAAAIIANSNRAYASDRGYRRSGWRSKCRQWYRQCDRGNDYACEKFETRGCTE